MINTGSCRYSVLILYGATIFTQGKFCTKELKVDSLAVTSG